MVAGAEAVVVVHLPGGILLHSVVDLPDQLLALSLVGLNRWDVKVGLG